MTNPVAPLAGKDLFATFVGLVDQAGTNRIANAVALASQGGVAHLHLIFQSTGGFVGDGVFLYYLFRACPVPLTLYNSGSISSIATVAYLGAQNRCVSAYGTFMIHRTHFTQPAMTAAQLEARVHSLTMDDQRSEGIIKEHVTLDAARWAELERNELWFSADEALRIGLANKKADFRPPPGSQIFNL